jgi:peroxiredoxin
MIQLPSFLKIAFCSCLGLTALTLADATAQSAVVGSSAPSFTATDTAGTLVDLGMYRGKIVVLEWFNPTCPFVKKFYSGGDMQKLQQEILDGGNVWLTIDSSAQGKPGHLTTDEALTVIKELGIKSTKLLLDGDGKVGRLYGARTTPHIFIIDAQGKLAYAGAIDNVPSTKASDIAGATNYIRTTVQALKTGAPVDPISTEPYGCSVKY